MQPDERIVRFLLRHHVLTLATAGGDGAPYCAHAFYCYDRERNLLVFAAGDETLHGRQMAAHTQVAFAAALETRVVGRVQGIQGCGIAAEADAAARKSYIARFPYAAAMPGLRLWSITPTFLKLTDNTLGFGKKLIWNAQE